MTRTLGIILLLGFIAIGLGYTVGDRTFKRVFLSSRFTKQDLNEILGKRLTSGKNFVGIETLEQPKSNSTLNIEYSIDLELQNTVEKLLKSGHLKYGAFVALNPATGQVLALASYGMKDENLALRATFPAASVFKIVTAASALENGVLEPDSKLAFRGGMHTLYKHNVMFSPDLNADHGYRHTRTIAFDEALAKSVNSIFGRVGLFGLGAEPLRKTALRFAFNKLIPFEMPVDVSNATIPDDDFGLAESASGFTRSNTISPLHGALMASAIVNDGVMVEPSIVRKVTDQEGVLLYSPESKSFLTSLDESTAQELAQMMHKTITLGTSRRSFRGTQRHSILSNVFIGGKTGTLTGHNPYGRYDWFVGFAQRDKTKIAVASLCIHGAQYGIKASLIARKAFENYFRSMIASHSIGNHPETLE